MNFIIFIVVVIVLLLSTVTNARREKLIKEGKGDYFVKIAASGKGGTYHTPSCGKCRSNKFITRTQARNLGYVPCSICGGRGVFSTFDQ